MSEPARVLQFPDRRARPALPPFEAAQLAIEHFAEDRQTLPDLDRSLVANPDYLSAACKCLEQRAEASPLFVAAGASRLHEAIEEVLTVGLFDERDYFLGETALLAARGCRHLGRRDEAERWLSKSEASFRHTLNPGPSLSNVSYARLTVRYEMRRYQEVVDFVPSLTQSFMRLGMKLEAAKSRFLLAAALKQLGRKRDAVLLLEQLCTDPVVKNSNALLGQVLVDLGEHLAADSNFPAAIASFQQALPLLKSANRVLAIAVLKLVIGDTFRKQNNLSAALKAFREATEDCDALGLSTYVAYLHVLTGETLLALNRPREAEWEILAALPTIESEKMVPEGFAALTLLRESVRQRKTDPRALTALREQLANQE